MEAIIWLGVMIAFAVGRGGHRRADQHLVCGRCPWRADYRWAGAGILAADHCVHRFVGHYPGSGASAGQKAAPGRLLGHQCRPGHWNGGVVTQAVNNLAGEGLVNLPGQVWSARSKTEEVIPAGQEVRVLHIQGVKVIVEPVTADQTKAV